MAPLRGNKLALPVLETPEQAKLRTWMETVRTFYRLQRRIMSLLAAQSITLPQFDVLATLRFGEGVTQQELAQQLLVSKGNICGVLDRLEALDWVQHRTDPSDARVNRVYLTPAGRSKVEAVLPAHDELILNVFAPFNATDLKEFRRLMNQLEHATDAA